MIYLDSTPVTYDGEGQRVSKTTGSTTTTYTYEGDQLVMQTTGNTSLFFLYDANGLIGFDHIVSGTTQDTYYYQIDGKGEIVGITDTAGNVVVKYTYDAWAIKYPLQIHIKRHFRTREIGSVLFVFADYPISSRILFYVMRSNSQCTLKTAYPAKLIPDIEYIKTE